MQRPQFVKGEIYHIYNRGVERRNVFADVRDRTRFLKSMREFNTTNPAAANPNRHPLFEVPLQTGGKPLVEILAFCLMPNHYHFMIRQTAEDGITQFMRKLGTGYTNYFNLRHMRVGPLFQGTFKAVLLEQEAHLIHLPHYIHLNPLDLSAPEWRNGTTRNTEKALSFLKTYPWSSLHDYLGAPKFPKIIQKAFLTEYIGRPAVFLVHMREWIQRPDFDFIPPSILHANV